MELAKDALERGQYTEAVKLCKQVLKQDRNNYDGFVLLGTTLVRSGQHLEQAEMSFKKALTLDSAALPAYQGLVELRESSGNEEQVEEARRSAFKSAKEAGDSALAIELARKLSAASSNNEQAKLLWEDILQMNLSVSQRLEVLCALVTAEAANMEANVEDYRRLNVLEIHLEEITQKLPHSERFQGLLLDLIRLKLRNASGSDREIVKRQALDRCLLILSNSPTASAVDILVAMVEEDGIEKQFRELELPNGPPASSVSSAWLGKRIAHLYPGRGLALFQHLRNEQKKFMVQAELLYDEHSVIGWRTLADLQAAEGLSEDAWTSAGRGLSAIARARKVYGLSLSKCELSLFLSQARILFSRRKYSEALNLFRKVAKDAQGMVRESRKSIIGAALKGIAEIFMVQMDIEMAKATLQNMLANDPEDHWALSERGWMDFQSKNFQEATANLERAVLIHPHSAKYRYRLARCFWCNGNREKAFTELIQSAKIDPGQPDTFYYLGQYYADDVRDVQKAVRCYRKVVELDSENATAGEALCDILESTRQYALEKEICFEASQRSHRAFWAWRRLGFIQTADKEWPQAVTTLQFALRHYTSDSCLWEALGLCYKKLGMFTASLKACGRAFDLDSSSAYSAIEIGNINLHLSAYLKAIRAFQQALLIIPNDQSAMYGLAAALLGQAGEYFALGAFSSGAAFLKAARELAEKGRGHFAAIWKQLGDSNLLYARMLPFNIRGTDPDKLVNAVHEWRNERLNAARNAVRAFKHALHLQPDNGSLYRDVCTALQLSHHLEGKEEPCWSLSEITACGGLEIDGGNADLWATLGLVSQHRGLKQHAFVQALRLNGTHAIAWSFLGQLYLSQDEELASLCFDRARSADPALPFPWAGMVSLPSSTHSESFSSCSYALYLSSSLELQTGLGQLAAKTHRLSLSQVNAALQQATERDPFQAEPHNLKGLSCESRGDLLSAISSFRRARAVASLCFEPGDLRSLAITSNIARTLCKMGLHDEAVKEYKQLFDAGALEKPNMLLGFATSLWHNGQRELAASFAKQALTSRLTSDAKRASATALYSKLLYSNGDCLPALEALSGVPEALFSHKELSLTTISLGVRSCKRDLLSTAIRSCHSILMSKHAPDANILLAVGTRINNGFGVTRNLVKAVHMYPQSHSLRAKLGEVLLAETQGSSSYLVERLCDTNAICSNDEVARRLSTMVVTDAVLAGSSRCMFSQIADATRQLQKLLHREPHNVVARYCLALVLARRAKAENHPPHLCEVVYRTATLALLQLSSSQSHSYIRAQLELCVSDCKLRAGDPEAAADHAENALKVASPTLKPAAVLQLACCFLALGDIASAKATISGWHELADAGVVSRLLLVHLELRLSSANSTAIGRLRETLEDGPHQNRWLALLEFVLARCSLEDDIEGAEAAAAKAVSLWSDNPILQLLHGAISLELVKSGKKPSLLSKAISSLSKAVQGKKRAQVPIACALLAQAESSRDGTRAGSLRKWAANLRSEYLTWPRPDSRPPELLFQMALVSRQSLDGDECPESVHSCRSWLQRALHINPACPKYWEMLLAAT